MFHKKSPLVNLYLSFVINECKRYIIYFINIFLNIQLTNYIIADVHGISFLLTIFINRK